MSTPHDTGYRALFSHAKSIEDLIRGYVHDPWLQQLDFTTLEQIPSNYVSDTFEQRANDVVWRVKVNQFDWVYLYVMVEFQSSNDNDMALRVMTYTGLLWQHLKKNGQIPPGHRYPPVLPIVLYNGGQRWTAPVELADLIVPTEGLLATFQPNMRYLIIDEGRIMAEGVLAERNLISAIIQIEHPPSASVIGNVVEKLKDVLDGKPELQRDVGTWIRSVFSRSPDRAILLPHVENLKEMGMTLHEVLAKELKESWQVGLDAGIEKGREEGIEKGIERGIEKGIEKGRGAAMATTLKRLLTKRFGPAAVSAAVVERIDSADPAHLEVWLERVLDAANVEAVLTDA
jgi:predicted transposase YdaD